MGSDGVDPSAIHDDHAICSLHRRNALCNDDFCGFRNVRAERFLNQSICLGIYSTGEVVQNQNFGGFKSERAIQSHCFFTVGDICASLLDIGAISIWKRGNKRVRLRQFVYLYQLFIGGILVALAQIFLWVS